MIIYYSVLFYIKIMEERIKNLNKRFTKGMENGIKVGYLLQ